MRARDIAPLTLDNALFALAGSFRSDGKGPGSADKHRYLGAKAFTFDRHFGQYGFETVP